MALTKKSDYVRFTKLRMTKKVDLNPNL